MIYYDRALNQVTLLEWAELLEDPAYRRVALDKVADCTVSTVWLGIDHGDGMFFETMVFDGSGNDVLCQRYPTEAAAVEGHRQAAAHVRNLEKKLKGRN